MRETFITVLTISYIRIAADEFENIKENVYDKIIIIQKSWKQFNKRKTAH